jgi:hypothetical protein
MKHIHIETRHVGEVVVCDACNDDYTDSTDSGGFLFGSHAYCPKCAKRSIERIKGYGEEKYIKDYCPEGMSFRDWCLKLRNGDNTIKTITVEDWP